MSALVAAVCLVMATVAAHVAGLSMLARRLHRIEARDLTSRGRPFFLWVVVSVTLCIVVLHMIEVWIWAAFYLVFVGFADWPTAVHFSLAAYSTVGADQCSFARLENAGRSGSDYGGADVRRVHGLHVRSHQRDLPSVARVSVWRNTLSIGRPLRLASIARAKTGGVRAHPKIARARPPDRGCPGHAVGYTQVRRHRTRWRSRTALSDTATYTVAPRAGCGMSEERSTRRRQVVYVTGAGLRAAVRTFTKCCEVARAWARAPFVRQTRIANSLESGVHCRPPRLDARGLALAMCRAWNAGSRSSTAFSVRWSISRAGLATCRCPISSRRAQRRRGRCAST